MSTPGDDREQQRGGGGWPLNLAVKLRLRNERLQLGLIGFAEDMVHYAVALILVGIAIVVLVDTTSNLITTKADFSTAATNAINGVLFAIIVLEVMRTVIAHFDRAGLQLQPFLIIGIISAVREILTVGARLSLHGQAAGGVVRTALLELGVNAAVVVGLAAALVLIRRLAGMIEPERVG